MGIRSLPRVIATLVTLAFVSVGCQPTPPIVDTEQATPEGSATRSGEVDIDIDRENGLNVDIDGKKGGGVDIDVGDQGVDVDVEKPDEEGTD